MHKLEIEKGIYVGCSRARNHLIVLLDRNAPTRVRRVFGVGKGRA